MKKAVFLVCFHLGGGRVHISVAFVYKRYFRKNHKKLVMVISYGWSCELDNGGQGWVVDFTVYLLTFLPIYCLFRKLLNIGK